MSPHSAKPLEGGRLAPLTIQHASRAIGDWISFYNHRRPHQALDMKTPAEAFALAA
ncbi:integrase core domain-containing protein [Gemmobacter denitrificans]|uniref:integrase core domain-containing protein n=1 Tax=Gemmobacter denitrificans TaxID=3123040 RepID=UPI003D9C75FF